MGLRGSLSELKLPDLIDLMSAGAKTGLVIIADEEGSGGELGFVDGVLVSARAGLLTGERAFFALLGITRGSFLVDAGRQPAGHDITVSAQSLLMEGMRRLDEVGELRQRLPGSAHVVPGCEGGATDELEAHLIAVVAAREQPVQEILRLFATAGRADEYECLQALQRLLDRGRLQLRA